VLEGRLHRACATAPALQREDQADGKDDIPQGDVGGEGSGLDADQIDGLDSTTFGITTQHNQQDLESCYTPGSSPQQACAPLTVVVPPGKRYVVSVWSTFSLYGS
jgi:hypothetical protein